MLSAYEVSFVTRGLCAETLICGTVARLATTDRESPLGLSRSGTRWVRRACKRVYRESPLFFGSSFDLSPGRSSASFCRGRFGGFQMEPLVSGYRP